MIIKKSLKMILVCLILFFTVSLFAENIVAILPFDSVFESIAQEQKDAILMALEDLNFDKELIFKDSKGSVEGAIIALEEYIKEYGNPEAVISCASWIATGLNPVTAEKGLFHIAIGSASIERKIKNHTIRMTVDEKKEEELLSYYLLQYNNIAVLFMDNQLGQNWSNTLNRKLGDKIKISLSYNPEKKDYNKSIKQIKSIEPDVVVLISSSNAADICKVVRQEGIVAQLVGTRPIERPEMLEAYSYTKGLIYTFPSYNTNHKMVSGFKEKYSYEPTFFGLEAYDTITSLITGLREVESDKLFEWYRNKNFTGALGNISVDANGDANYPYMFKEIKDGQFVIADFQYALLLEHTRQEINTIFNKMDVSLNETAKKLSAGITGKKADKALKDLFEQNSYSFDVVTIDPKGIIRNVHPKNNLEILGKDISNQEQVIRMIETHKPVVSKAFKAIEGFVGFDFEYPVFDKKDNYIGAVSILTKPDFFAEIINSKIASFPVEICIMQTDGVIVYDINEEEIGLNLFIAELFNDYTSLRELGRRMAIYPQGFGTYNFLDKNMQTVVEKELIWTNVSIHGTEFRVALFYEK